MTGSAPTTRAGLKRALQIECKRCKVPIVHESRVMCMKCMGWFHSGFACSGLPSATIRQIKNDAVTDFDCNDCELQNAIQEMDTFEDNPQSQTTQQQAERSYSATMTKLMTVLATLTEEIRGCRVQISNLERSNENLSKDNAKLGRKMDSLTKLVNINPKYRGNATGKNRSGSTRRSSCRGSSLTRDPLKPKKTLSTPRKANRESSIQRKESRGDKMRRRV